jgi:hypothetical protein
MTVGAMQTSAGCTPYICHSFDCVARHGREESVKLELSEREFFAELHTTIRNADVISSLQNAAP